MIVLFICADMAEPIGFATVRA